METTSKIGIALVATLIHAKVKEATPAERLSTLMMVIDASMSGVLDEDSTEAETWKKCFRLLMSTLSDCGLLVSSERMLELLEEVEKEILEGSPRSAEDKHE